MCEIMYDREWKGRERRDGEREENYPNAVGYELLGERRKKLV